jgi:hypothetical protein
MSPLEPPAERCLARTRSAVMNILVAVGIGIAVSGLLLRGHAREAVPRAPESVRRALLAGLLAVTVLGYTVRRVLGGRSALADPALRAVRFYWAHVLSAALGALAIPLGLAYGWLIRPRLDAVAPFWVAALALGFLALPRLNELDDFSSPMPSSSESQA